MNMILKTILSLLCTPFIYIGMILTSTIFSGFLLLIIITMMIFSYGALLFSAYDMSKDLFLKN